MGKKTIKDEDKILLHLSHQKEHENEDTVPYAVCQRGISERIGLSYGRVGGSLDELIENDLVKREARSVVGLQRERKVYFPTSKGYRRAEKELRKSLGNKEVTVKTKDGKEKVRLKDIEEYKEGDHPMLSSLKQMNENGVVDLTESADEKEDVFVGRKEEMEKMKEMLEDVKRDGCSILFVTGEAGVGKTRLVSEFKDHAVSHGFEFLSGNAYYDSSEPYLPLREAFKEYMERESERMEDFADMAMLGAKASNKKPKIQDKNMFDAERTADWNKSADRVKKMASKRPLLVFLDDMQWSDQTTLQFLHYMVTGLSDSPILFIAAYRVEDVTAEHPMVEFKRRMGREHLFEELKLDDLDNENTRAIIEGQIGREDIPESFVEMVHDTAEGNPLFTREIVKKMIEEEMVDLKDGKCPENIEAVNMLDVIADVVRKRIEMMSEGTKAILYRAAVMGEEVSFELLTNVVDMNDLDLLDHLDMLGELGLMYEDPSSENFLFSHGLIHRAIFDQISPRKRKKIHQLVADGMEEFYQQRGKLDSNYSDLAYHHEKGDGYEKAVENYYRAGQKAEEVYAHEDAIEMYKRALNLSDDVGDDISVGKITVLEELGDAHRITGEYDEAIDRYRQAAETALMDNKKIQLYRKIAKVYEEKGDFERSLEECEKGLNILDYDVTVQSAKILGRKGWALLRQGKHEKAEDIFSKRLEITDELEDKEESGQAEHDIGTVYLQMGKYDKAQQHLQKALKIRKEIDDESDIASTFNNLGYLYDGKGDLERSLEYHQKGLEIDEKTGNKWGTAISLNNIGTLYLRLGELDKAIERYERSLKIGKLIGDKRGIASTLSNMARVHLQREELEEALENFEECLEICDDIGAKLYRIDTLSGLAETDLRLGHREKALERAKEAVDTADEIGAEGIKGPAHRVLGMVYREMGEFERSEKEFQEGKELLKNLGEKVEMPPILYEYGLLLEEMGRKKNAKIQLKTGLDLAEKMEMKLWRERLESALDERFD